MEQQKLEKAKSWYHKVNQPDSITSDSDAEKMVTSLLLDPQFDSEEIVSNLIALIKKDLHEEKKILENYRDRVEKINIQLQQL